MKKTIFFSAWALICFFVFFYQKQVFGVPLEYRLKVGATYCYEIVTKIQTDMEAWEDKYSQPLESTTIASVSVVAFRNNLFLIDIDDGEKWLRRYLRKDGTVFLAPSETIFDLPFFIVFPSDDWNDGKTNRIQTSIQQGKTNIPIRWELTTDLKGASKERKILKINGTADLPVDRVIQRVLSITGSMTWNNEEGCFESGNLTIEYSLGYSNKEIAVIRPLWKYKEKRTVSFKLKEVKK